MLSDPYSNGKKINAIRKVNKQLKNNIEEMTDAKTIYDDMIEKYTTIHREYDTELIITQEHLNEIEYNIRDKKKYIIDLENKKDNMIEKYREEALNGIDEMLENKKHIMDMEIENYKKKYDRDIEYYKNIKKDEYVMYSDLHRQVYLQKTQQCEEKFKQKEYELLKAEEKLDKILEDLYNDLQTKKNDIVWQYIETHDVLNIFLELVREKEKKKLDIEREIKINAMNKSIDKRREELLVKLREEIDNKRTTELIKLDKEIRELPQKKR